MSAAEYPSWREHAVASFAADVSRATGVDLDAATERATTLFEQLLPDGRASEGTHILTVVDEAGTSVGALWIGPHPQRPDAVFAYDIEIAEEHRGRGLGRAAIVAVERMLADEGVVEIGLSVFGFNAGAQRLYESLGFRVVSTQMTKTIS